MRSESGFGSCQWKSSGADESHHCRLRRRRCCLTKALCFRWRSRWRKTNSGPLRRPLWTHCATSDSCMPRNRIPVFSLPLTLCPRRGGARGEASEETSFWSPHFHRQVRHHQAQRFVLPLQMLHFPARGSPCLFSFEPGLSRFHKLLQPCVVHIGVDPFLAAQRRHRFVAAQSFTTGAAAGVSLFVFPRGMISLPFWIVMITPSRKERKPSMGQLS